MNVKIKLAFAFFAALTFTACGGGSGGSGAKMLSYKGKETAGTLTNSNKTQVAEQAVDAVNAIADGENGMGALEFGAGFAPLPFAASVEANGSNKALITQVTSTIANSLVANGVNAPVAASHTEDLSKEMCSKGSAKITASGNERKASGKISFNNCKMKDENTTIDGSMTYLIESDKNHEPTKIVLKYNKFSITQGSETALKISGFYEGEMKDGKNSMMMAMTVTQGSVKSSVSWKMECDKNGDNCVYTEFYKSVSGKIYMVKDDQLYLPDHGYYIYEDSLGDACANTNNFKSGLITLTEDKTNGKTLIIDYNEGCNKAPLVTIIDNTPI